MFPRAFSALIATLCLFTAPAHAAFSYSVAVQDPSATLTAKTKAAVLANLDGAIQQWKKAIKMNGKLKILIKMEVTPYATVDCSSTGNTWSGYRNKLSVYEEGASYTIRTGANVKPGSPDMVIRINPAYLQNEAWLDPRPALRIDPVPANKIDFVSVLTHELAHAFGFNGFVDQASGQPNPEYLSVFDSFIKRDASGVYFTGPQAMRVYGGPIPLTAKNYYHYASLNDPALLGGIMNGISFAYGNRYSLSAIDLAILQDLGHARR